MKYRHIHLNMPFIRVLALAILTFIAGASALAQAPAGDAKRGLYIANAAGCVGCHTAEGKDATPFAGGRALKTPFGTFYGPNITPHPEAGIGKWTEADLVRALRLGERPDGAHYFPAFPYSSFTRMSDADIRDLWAYLRALPPSDRKSQPHDLGFPFNLRFLVTGWKLLYFTPGEMKPDPKLAANVNRGAYLAMALGHCSECHTPRNFLGGLNDKRLLGGNKNGPEGKSVPNITPTRLKKLSDADLKEYLISGLTPDGDTASETMAEVIRNTTSKLSPEDLAALVAYLRSVPPVEVEK